MANRNIHYEAAFEAFLRERKTPYVVVDEAKKAMFGNATLKSFDFVVYSQSGPNLLIDVKGRQARNSNGGRTYQTWATEKDVEDLLQWQQVFGNDFQAVLAFLYWIDPPLIPEPGAFEFRERWYVLMGIELKEYRDHMRRRSAKWETVSLSTESFRQLARPLESWL
ncbi:MAG: HYExAFE family protein [Tepidisphaeraceae bacterium]